MASGTPDYFQTVRQVYGAAKIATEWKVVTANAFTNMKTIIGKGVLYGGYLYMDTVSTQKNSYPALYIDGASVLALTFDSLNKFGVQMPRSSILTIDVFDEVNFIYKVGFSFGITFDSSLKLDYREMHGGTPTVYATLMYALME